MTTHSLESELVLHEVPHHQQRFNWDCGVTCVLMLLDAEQRQHMLQNFESICEEEGFGRSTWTIDLCYLLKRFKVPHRMYTSMMGVNEHHRKQNYYDKIIHLDRDRVQERFSLAAASGVHVVPRGLRDGELLGHLKKGPVVLLVDGGLLACDLCKHNKMKFEFRRCFGGGYRGHYILLVGISRDRILYRDPALSARVCAASIPRVLRAHRALGTDHDAVIVYNSCR